MVQRLFCKVKGFGGFFKTRGGIKKTVVLPGRRAVASAALFKGGEAVTGLPFYYVTLWLIMCFAKNGGFDKIGCRLVSCNKSDSFSGIL
jgi:hypothetical protein